MYNIIVMSGAGANHHIRMSLVNAWRACGYNVYYWQPEGKSAFDAFSEFPCDIFIGDTWQLNRAIIKCLTVRPNIKTILYGDIWGDIQNHINVEKYPVGIASDGQKHLVEKLIRQTNKIPVIISNHGNKCVQNTHGKWSELGCTVHSVLVSADITNFFPREHDDEYEVELFFCGGYWTYKSINLDKYITPLLYPNTKWRTRIAGSGWSGVNSIGMITDDETAKHYTNASIVPHVVEPHCSDIYQDLPLRYFQAAACGGFAISCPVIDIRDIFSDNELTVATDQKDFIEKIVHFLNNPECTDSFRQNAYKKVMSNHTGFHRCKQIFDILNVESDSLDDSINRIKTGIN